MNEQTKVYYWLPWSIAISIGLILFWGLEYFAPNWPGIWEIAHAVDTIRAINEFGSGMFDMAPYWEERVRIFTGIILIFVLGPTLWICSEVNNQEREISEPEDRLKKGPAWYAGVILVIVGLTYAIPGTVTKGMYFNDTWESADKNREVDRMRSDLLTLAADAAEFYFLSYRDGGESGFRMKGESGGFSLKDLKSYKQETPGEYVLGDAVTDSSVTIYAVGNFKGSNPDFENANGEKGKIQLAVEVRPESKLFEFIHKNTNML